MLRYARGYVARKLLEHYEKKHGDVVEQYVMCSGEMAVEEKVPTSLITQNVGWS